MCPDPPATSSSVRGDLTLPKEVPKSPSEAATIVCGIFGPKFVNSERL